MEPEIETGKKAANSAPPEKYKAAAKKTQNKAATKTRKPSDDEKLADAAARRKKRKHMHSDGQKTKLYAPERPGYYRRWVNQEGTRVEDLLDKGFLPVENNRGDNRYIYSEQTGGAKIQRVGVDDNGNPIRAVLMEQPNEFREEDVNAELAEINKVQDQIMNGNVAGGLGDSDHSYGSFEAFGRRVVKPKTTG